MAFPVLDCDEKHNVRQHYCGPLCRVLPKSEANVERKMRIDLRSEVVA